MYNTVIEELIDYSNDIISGKILACKYHILACKRFLKDLERMQSDEFEYYWDELEAKRVIKWYSYCKHSKGAIEGQPIILNSWAKFVVCNIEAWKHKDTNVRRFRFAYIQVGRKNQKSQLEAGMGGYECGAKGYQAAEVYCLGSERDQAKIVFDEVDLMLGKQLKKKFKTTQKEIRHRNSKSFIKHLSKKAGKTGDGKNPQMAIIDEYHAHPDSKMYDVMKSGMMARKEPLLIIITTAGFDYEDSACYSEYLDCIDILDGDIDNEQYFVMICQVEEGDDPYDEKNWIKANPVLCTYEEGLNGLRANAKLAKTTKDLRKRLDWFTKNLNMWVEGGADKYLEMKYWKNCKGKLTLNDFKGYDCFVGFDLSQTDDLTSVGVIIPYEDQETGKQMFFVDGQSFIPEKVLKEKEVKENIPYADWIEKKFLTKTYGNEGLVVDLSMAKQYILNLQEKYGLNIIDIGYDPRMATQFVADLENNEGLNCTMVYPGHKYLNEPTVLFRDLIKIKRINHSGNKLINWALKNCEVDEKKSTGEIMLCKTVRNKKIDPAAALINAMKVILLNWGYIEIDNEEEVQNTINRMRK